MLPEIKSPIKKGQPPQKVSWMSRTSDIVGSHVKTDLTDQLALIRRKIQEKCATTQDLITNIRRNKIGDGVHVTPNEFRYTLIKFGVIFPQSLVDKIFGVFDSDNSGTMDFDEFAGWIMSSEFKPIHENDPGFRPPPAESVESILRKKMLKCVQNHPDTFALMKPRTLYMEFISDVVRKNMTITENDARNIFIILDPQNRGYIEPPVLTHWANTGVVERPPSMKEKPREKQTLAVAILKLCGRNLKTLAECFAHIPKNSNYIMKYDEFCRSLLDKGLGTDRSLSKDVFDNLVDPSKPNVAQLDILFKYIAQYQFKDEAKPAESGKNAPHASLGVSRIDRRLREALRKCFTQLKTNITAKGKDGYVESDILYDMIVKDCMPLTYQDFRLMIQQFDLQNGGSRVNFYQFLNAYNPLNTVHLLDGVDATKKLAASLAPRSNSNRNNSSASLINDNAYDDESVVSAMTVNTNPIRRSSSNSGVDMRKIWQTVLRECHKNDPERSGLVSRVSFITALSLADPTMTPQMINDLADEYTLSQGLIDYLSCFRTYLNDMVGSMTQSKSQVAFNESELKKNSLVRDKGALHPWEFSQGKTKNIPYWKQVSSKKEPSAEVVVVPPASKKSANELNPQEKQALISKYSDPVLQTCSKCYKYFLPVWRDVRNDFKRGQISSQKGSILTTNFYLVLGHYGVKLSKNEMEGLVKRFRGLGMQDVVQFDEFLRVCLLVKDRRGGQGSITIATHND